VFFLLIDFRITDFGTFFLVKKTRYLEQNTDTNTTPTNIHKSIQTRTPPPKPMATMLRTDGRVEWAGRSGSSIVNAVGTPGSDRVAR
jgi:hypothetical protein